MRQIDRTGDLRGHTWGIRFPSSRGTALVLAASLFLLAGSGCSRSPERSVSRTPPTRGPDVLLAPTEVVETSPSAPSPLPTAAVQSAEFVVVLPTPVPTVDIASIPNLDRPREPVAKTVRERMARCFTFFLNKQDLGPITGRHIVRVEVRVRSSCSNTAFVGEECWFEVRARDRAGNVVARQVGQFQSPIGPLGEAVTFVDLAATIDDRLEASPW